MFEKSRNTVENVLVFICFLVCGDVCNEEIGVLVVLKINMSLNSGTRATSELRAFCEGKVVSVQGVSKECE